MTISSAAEEFRAHVKEFWEIKQRSQSLNDADRERLIHIVDFLENELKDIKHFLDLDQRTYMADTDKKRNAERWVENIVNASIDIAMLGHFDNTSAVKLSRFAKLRNILAHEYLDVRFKYIRQFIDEAEPLYKQLLVSVKRFIAK